MTDFEPWFPGDPGPQPAEGNVSQKLSQFLAGRIQAFNLAMDDRNQLVRDMHKAGYGRHEIARELRIGRTTVYRILGARYIYDHGLERWTEPSEDPYP